MAINQNIQTFYQTAQTRDFSRDFLFRITQIGNGVGLPTLDENDFVYIKAAKLPGRVIENVNASYMGLKFNIPGAVTYEGSDAYDIELYLDSVSGSYTDLRRKFEDASRKIFNDAISTGDYNIPGLDNTLELAQLDKQLNAINYTTLVGAQLRKIDAIEYKMAEGKGEVMTMKATLSYHYYVLGRTS
jgi:hypothetical protein